MGDIGDKINTDRSGFVWREPAPKLISKSYDAGREILVFEGGSTSGVLTEVPDFKSPDLNGEYYENIMVYINDVEFGLGLEETDWFAYKTIPSNDPLPSGAASGGFTPEGDLIIRLPMLPLLGGKSQLVVLEADFEFANYHRDIRDAWSRLGEDGKYLYRELRKVDWGFHAERFDIHALKESVDIPPTLAMPYFEDEQKTLGNAQSEFVSNLRPQSWSGVITGSGNFERYDVLTATNNASGVQPLLRINKFLEPDVDGEMKIRELDLAVMLEVPGQYAPSGQEFDQAFNYIYAVEKDGTLHAITKSNVPSVKIDDITGGVVSRAFIPPQGNTDLLTDELIDGDFISDFWVSRYKSENDDKIYNYSFPHVIVESVNLNFSTVTGGSFLDANGVSSHARIYGHYAEDFAPTWPSAGINASGETPQSAIFCNGTNQLLYTSLGYLKTSDVVPQVNRDLFQELGPQLAIDQSEPSLDKLITKKLDVRNFNTGNGAGLKIFDIMPFTGFVTPFNFPSYISDQRRSAGAGFCDRGGQMVSAPGGNMCSQVLMATDKGVIAGVFSAGEVFADRIEMSIVCDPDIVLIPGNFKGICEYKGNTFEDLFKIQVSDGSKVEIYQLNAPTVDISSMRSYLEELWDVLIGGKFVHQKFREQPNSPAGFTEPQDVIDASIAIHKELHAGLFDEFDSFDYRLPDGSFNFLPLYAKFHNAITCMVFDSGQQDNWDTTSRNTGSLGNLQLTELMFVDQAKWNSVRAGLGFSSLFEMAEFMAEEGSARLGLMVDEHSRPMSQNGSTVLIPGGLGMPNLEGLNDLYIAPTFFNIPHVHPEGTFFDFGGLNSEAASGTGPPHSTKLTSANTGLGRSYFGRIQIPINGDFLKDVDVIMNSKFKIDVRQLKGFEVDPVNGPTWGMRSFMSEFLLEQTEGGFVDSVNGLTGSPTPYLATFDLFEPHRNYFRATPSGANWVLRINRQGISNVRDNYGYDTSNFKWHVQGPSRAQKDDTEGTPNFPDILHEDVFFYEVSYASAAPRATDSFTIEDELGHTDYILVQDNDDEDFPFQNKEVGYQNFTFDISKLPLDDGDIESNQNLFYIVTDEAIGTSVPPVIPDDPPFVEQEAWQLGAPKGIAAFTCDFKYTPKKPTTNVTFDVQWQKVTEFIVPNGVNCICEPIPEPIMPRFEGPFEFNVDIAPEFTSRDIFSWAFQRVSSPRFDFNVDDDTLKLINYPHDDEALLTEGNVKPSGGSSSGYPFQGGKIGNLNKSCYLHIGHSIEGDEVQTVRDTSAVYDGGARVEFDGFGLVPYANEKQFFGEWNGIFDKPQQPDNIVGNFSTNNKIGASFVMDVGDTIEITHTGEGPVLWTAGLKTQGRIIDAFNPSGNFLGKNFAIDRRSSCIGFTNKFDPSGSPSTSFLAQRSSVSENKNTVLLHAIRPGRDRFIYATDELGQTATTAEVFVRGESCFIARTRDFNIDTDMNACVNYKDVDGNTKLYPASKTKNVDFEVSVGSGLDVFVIYDDCKNMPGNQTLEVFTTLEGNDLVVPINEEEDAPTIIIPIAGIDGGEDVPQNDIDKRYLTGGTPRIKKFRVTGITPGSMVLKVSTDANKVLPLEEQVPLPSGTFDNRFNVDRIGIKVLK